MPSIKLVSTANEGRPLKLCVHPSSTHGTSALSETKLRSRRFVEVVDDPDPNQYPPIVWLIMPIERLRRRLEDRPGLEVEHQHLIDSRLIRVPLHLFVLFFCWGGSSQVGSRFVCLWFHIDQLWGAVCGHSPNRIVVAPSPGVPWLTKIGKALPTAGLLKHGLTESDTS